MANLEIFFTSIYQFIYELLILLNNSKINKSRSLLWEKEVAKIKKNLPRISHESKFKDLHILTEILTSVSGCGWVRESENPEKQFFGLISSPTMNLVVKIEHTKLRAS